MPLSTLVPLARARKRTKEKNKTKKKEGRKEGKTEGREEGISAERKEDGISTEEAKLSIMNFSVCIVYITCSTTSCDNLPLNCTTSSDCSHENHNYRTEC